MRGVALNLKDCVKSKIAPPTYFLGKDTSPSQQRYRYPARVRVRVRILPRILKLVLCHGKGGPLGTISPLRLGSSVLTGYVM